MSMSKSAEIMEKFVVLFEIEIFEIKDMGKV